MFGKLEQATCITKKWWKLKFTITVVDVRSGGHGTNVVLIWGGWVVVVS